MKKIAGLVLVAMIAGYAGAWVFQLTRPSAEKGSITPINLTDAGSHDNSGATFSSNRSAIPDNLSDDFTFASSKSTQSVVYIKNISQSNYGYSWFDYFFGESPRNYQSVSSGSGVIFSSDGYVVTNNHVIEGADAIVVGPLTWRWPSTRPLV